MSFITSQTADVIGAIGQTVTGVGQLFSAGQEEKVGEFNAKVLEQRAQAERSSQILLEQQKRKVIKSRIGAQVAIFGSSGIKLTGTPLDVMLDSLNNAEMDLAIDKYNSEISARGFETEAGLEKYKASQRARTIRAGASKTFLSASVDLLKSQEKKKDPEKLGD